MMYDLLTLLGLAASLLYYAAIFMLGLLLFRHNEVAQYLGLHQHIGRYVEEEDKRDQEFGSKRTIMRTRIDVLIKRVGLFLMLYVAIQEFINALDVLRFL